MSNIVNNSGISKDLRAALADLEKEGFSSDLKGSKIKIRHASSGALAATIGLRPTPSGMRNMRGRISAFLRGIEPDERIASQDESGAEPFAPTGPAAEQEEPTYADQFDPAPEGERDDVTSSDPFDGDLGASEDETRPAEAQAPAETENLEKTVEETPVTDQQTAPVAEDTLPTNETVDFPDLAEEGDGDREEVVAKSIFAGMLKLSGIGEAQMTILDMFMRGDAPQERMQVTSDMVGDTLMIVDGSLVVVPADLMRIAQALAPASQARRPSAPTKSVRRADAVSRRMGEIPARNGQGSTDMTDALLDVFSRRPDEALRARDIYAMLPETIRKRYKGFESCSASFNKIINGMIAGGILKEGARDGREKTWVAV